MSSNIYPVPTTITTGIHFSDAEYKKMYDASVKNPDAFWRTQLSELDWFKTPTVIKNTNFSPNSCDIKWFEDGKLNASYNCIDRHLKDKADEVAIYWEGDSPEDSEQVTFQTLHDEVCKLANGLKKLGVKKGDCVAIYMPMVPHAAYAMLACARIGAVHSVIFGGFSPNAIADRINNSQAKVVITSDEGRRAGRSIVLKENVDEALKK